MSDDLVKSHIEWLRGDHEACNPFLADRIEALEARAEKAGADARKAYTHGLEDAAKVVGEKSDAARKKLGQCVSEGHPEDEHVWSAIVSHLDLAHSSIRARAAINREENDE